MNEQELIHLWALLGECEAALDLIVNHQERANLDGGGRDIFRNTLDDVANFKRQIGKKYGGGLQAITATMSRN
jgi:hypothetical protein